MKTKVMDIYVCICIVVGLLVLIYYHPAPAEIPAPVGKYDFLVEYFESCDGKEWNFVTGDGEIPKKNIQFGGREKSVTVSCE